MKIISSISIFVAENRYVVKPRIYFGILLPHATSCIINPTVFTDEILLCFFKKVNSGIGWNVET
uniref:Uncharacterized protein n=1 Tax=Saimiri boliviensis boliviensis TaxID=39432 RepID=A0A2K6TVR1_SAIBB